MVLGAIWCPLEKTREISTRIRQIKAEHGFPSNFEIKWTKVSPSKASFYSYLIDYFFDNDALHFRALVARDKYKLRHEDYGQDHDTWYYKMYYEMLKAILNPPHCYRIYIDIKDTRGGTKIAKLHEILCSSVHDLSASIVERAQIIRSNESEIMQMTDLLCGAICYANRGLSENSGKVAVVNRVRERSNYDLMQTTAYKEEKVNLFIWSPSEGKE
jgi:hypothetical protein